MFMCLICCLALHTLCIGQGIKRPVPKAAPPTLADSIEVVYVQGGTFAMGSESGFLGEKPVHKVTLSSYSIGKYEITQQQWTDVMGSNPSAHKDCANCPVENVSWDEIQSFLRQLNAKYKGHHYRLPTESEWEFAARGGNKSNDYDWSGAATQNELNDYAWFIENSGSQTHPVGTKQANELGIYDMSGNVWEWCADWYGVYSSEAQTNPTGAATGADRVGRGGGWGYRAIYCRSACRRNNMPARRNSAIGFRVVCTP
jgi:formylglycine-generating enzyme required for sulfatase activity